MCVCLEMAVLGASDRLQGGIYLKFMWISWKQLFIPFHIYRAAPLLFLLSLESPELRGVVWGCFPRLLREVATNLMIHIRCPSLGGPGELSCCAGHGCSGPHWDGIDKAPETGISALFLYRWHVFFLKLQHLLGFLPDLCAVTRQE